MARLGLIFLLLLALLVAVFAWSNATIGGKADFTFITRAEIGTLDPNRMSWVQDIRVGYALWEGLYTLDPATLKPIPGTAERIDISPDQQRYTFHLRPQARWSNGDPVTASDFVFAWRRMLDQPGDYTYLFDAIRGASQYREAVAAKRPADFSHVGITILDDRTLQVDLDHPVAYFPDLCAFCPFWPLHQASMQPFYDPATSSYQKQFTRPPALVTNGPFRLVSWSFRQKIRMESNAFYWNHQNVKLRSIDVLISNDPMWGFLKYDSNAADWIPDGTGPIGRELYARKRPDMHVFAGFGTYMYKLNCQPTLPDGRPNPFHDARVRRAFSLAINRQGIVDRITQLGEPVAGTFIPPGVFAGYQSPPVQLEDLQLARQLLSDAGYPGGKGFPSVSIVYNSEAHHGDVAQYARRQWLENLNIDVGLEQLEVKVFRERLHSTNFTIARASWMGDYNDPSTFLECYLSGSENNDTKWANSQYDALIASAACEPDQQKRLRLFEQAETLLLEEQPIIPLYHYVNAYLFRPDVTGIALNPRNMVMFGGVEVKNLK